MVDDHRVYLVVKMGALDSVADFSLNGEIFQSTLPLFKPKPKLTPKDVKIVVKESEAPQRYVKQHMTKFYYQVLVDHLLL